jgi:hypothetical protein
MGADYLFGNDFTPFEACHGRIYPGLLSGYIIAIKVLKIVKSLFP